MRRRRSTLRPFDSGGRWAIAAIFVTFAAMAAVSVSLTLSATGRSKDYATVVQIAGRQRTLAERYLAEVMLVRGGRQANPGLIASTMSASATALLEGGTAPSVNGDDDATELKAAEGQKLRNQLREESALIGDMTATGEALLNGTPTAVLPSAGHEHIATGDPLQRLRVLVAITSAVALNASRTIASSANAGVQSLIDTQIALAIGGLVLSLLLGTALIVTTRKQTTHFRTLAQSSTDLVAVVGDSGCRYVSRSLAAELGRPENELLGDGLARCVHTEDRETVADAARTGTPTEFTVRVRDAGGSWRQLEAQLTDLRGNRDIRGVVINARDATERLRLEHELTAQAQRDGFASQLGEALEMADEEHEVCTVVELAMQEASEPTPMELLLSDSSRANLRTVAAHPAAGAPGCPVKSPFSCVAVRRGSAVVFDSSSDLNACPQLRERGGGACSAVCVPVSFMGRSLGVLHTTGPDGAPLDPDAVARLSTLAAQAGARIGTVRAFEKTQLQASTDGLTGLVNRRTAEAKLRDMIGGGQLFSLALADLDHFKSLNDTHGHEAGDRALRLFAQVTQDTLREHDFIARWGGEEFVIVMAELDRFQAVSVVDRVRAHLAVAHPGETARFTASFGIADSNQSGTLEEIVAIADGGLYAAKNAGRDRAKIGEAGQKMATAHANGNGNGNPPKPASEKDDRGEEPAGKRRGGKGAPSIQLAAAEEEPRPSGIEIR